MKPSVHTIGHSRHPLDHFLGLLRCHAIATLVDVRSLPYSKWAPHFEKRRLSSSLQDVGLGYVWLGDTLGGRPDGREFYDAQGRLDHARRRQAADFQAGLDRLVALARGQSIAIMCAEEDPDRCHRRLLIAPALADEGISVIHLRGDGRIESEPASTNSVQPGLFDA